jgi:hypothetical protein
VTNSTAAAAVPPVASKSSEKKRKKTLKRKEYKIKKKKETRNDDSGSERQDAVLNFQGVASIFFVEICSMDFAWQLSGFPQRNKRDFQCKRERDSEIVSARLHANNAIQLGVFVSFDQMINDRLPGFVVQHQRVNVHKIDSLFGEVGIFFQHVFQIAFHSFFLFLFLFCFEKSESQSFRVFTEFFPEFSFWKNNKIIKTKMQKFARNVVAKGFEIGLMKASKRIAKKYPIEQMAEEFNLAITQAVDEVQKASDEIQKSLEETQKLLDETEKQIKERDHELDQLKSTNENLRKELLFYRHPDSKVERNGDIDNSFNKFAFLVFAIIILCLAINVFS